LEHFDGIESYSVKHLPIVKAYAGRLGLVELVNYLVPSQMELPPGIFFLEWYWIRYLEEILCIVWSNSLRSKTLSCCWARR